MPPTRRTLVAAACATAAYATGAGHLMPGPAHAQGREATPAGFAGRVFVNDNAGPRLHTYLSDAKGALVTSHLIETASGLVLIDGQFAPEAAREVKRYIETLGLPLARVWVSHQHPDHWFGLHHIGARAVQALPGTAAFLQQSGAALIAQRGADSAVPEVTAILNEGETVIGGVTFRLRRVLDTEAPEMLVVELPQAGAAIVQDLVYNRVHAVVSRQLTGWVAVLRGLIEDGARTPLLLAGHGEPTAPADLGGLVRYLETVQGLMRPGAAPDPIVAEMEKAFPEYRLPWLLKLGLGRSLPA